MSKDDIINVFIKQVIAMHTQKVYDFYLTYIKTDKENYIYSEPLLGGDNSLVITNMTTQEFVEKHNLQEKYYGSYHIELDTKTADKKVKILQKIDGYNIFKKIVNKGKNKRSKKKSGVSYGSSSSMYNYVPIFSVV